MRLVASTGVLQAVRLKPAENNALNYSGNSDGVTVHVILYWYYADYYRKSAT